MDTKDEEFQLNNFKNDSPDAIKEFNKKLTELFKKKLPTKDAKIEFEKIKKELKEKYSTQEK